MILSLILLLSQLSSGIEFKICRDCHGDVVPISPSSLTKDCMTCHGNHGNDVPKTRSSEVAHDIHGNIRKKSDRKDCQTCHRNRPIECIRCHNSHMNTGTIIVGTSSINMSNTSTCTNCHGELPQPRGHSDFRDYLKTSKHSWMNCDTCHINIYDGIENINNRINGKIDATNKSYEFALHFSDLYMVSINDSTNLCKICHSAQYAGLEEGTHGDVGKTCINCHNPHTTKFGVMIGITPKQTPSNISTKVESFTDWMTTEVPILRNSTALYVIIIIILTTVLEYILSKDEEGKKTTYNTIKIHDNEDTLKTLEIGSINKDISAINNLLETNGVNILGMTMKKEEEYGDIDIYKYVIFVNMTRPIDEDSLVGKIATMDYIKSAIFTDKYEL